MLTKVTINDIAAKLKINASTVSRALSNHTRISEATRRLVHKTAKELNYKPNNIAAALRIGKSHLIGVIVPTADRVFFSSVIRGIESIANSHHYSIIICHTYDDYEKEVATVGTLINARVDAIIASIAKSSVNKDHFQSAIDLGIPLVLFDRACEELNVNQVIIDDFQGAYDIVSHLIEQGCSRIAHFTRDANISIYRERLRGYKKALMDNQIPYDKKLVVESDLKLYDGRMSMKKLLKLTEKPDGIFSASDFAALGAMQVLKEMKLRIPEDVALAGFSNEPFTLYTDPSLTTVDQSSFYMGQIAAETVFKNSNAAENVEESPRRTILKPKLIVRESSLRRGKVVV